MMGNGRIPFYGHLANVAPRWRNFLLVCCEKRRRCLGHGKAELGTSVLMNLTNQHLKIYCPDDMAAIYGAGGFSSND